MAGPGFVPQGRFARRTAATFVTSYGVHVFAEVISRFRQLTSPFSPTVCIGTRTFAWFSLHAKSKDRDRQTERQTERNEERMSAAGSMRLRKLARYSRFVPELLEQGIEYQPLTWSCYGREHRATSAASHCLHDAAARRQGDRSWRHRLRVLRAGVGAALARRAAAMVAACFGAPAG